ncbi:TonB-dependent receptor [Pontibacter sp. G13]|uniref:TonB-dependent receptor n=1 Tax=Pontibacter sp. G13 TaxID=3074898 RepID=UPI00288C378F|nr:TonB-dependent receptor [Pontibacter sp. G13]WNJ18376.1 TonB-dependent receptor [Pontibacter sp. G13]
MANFFTRTLLFWMMIPGAIFGQDITGKLNGVVIDQQSEAPVPFAQVSLEGTTEAIGTMTDDQGKFSLEGIPVGRHTLKVATPGFEPQLVSEVLVSSGHNPTLRIALKEKSYQLDEVELRPTVEKQKSVNPLSTVSAQQVSMEEANRFAGGFDDPARMVSSFAGVASNVGENGIVVRGNSPKGVLWRMEGVAISNPNHFAEVTGFGGGGITALSSKMLANSDFFTSAFPAEYGNALSSVFDLSVRNGNSDEYQHSIQLGMLGLDVASEGPIVKGKQASYLVNYRYSTFGMIDSFLPADLFGIQYQDLAFKINLPTKAGTFSIWGLGLLDEANSVPDTDTSYAEAKWRYQDDWSTENSELGTAIGGITHKILVNEKGYVKTVLTANANRINAQNSQLDTTFEQNWVKDRVAYDAVDLRLSSLLNYKFGARHTNRTGVIISHMDYDFHLQEAPEIGESLETFAEDAGSAQMVQAFTQSSIHLGKVQINPGIHYLYFNLSDAHSIEPRLGVSYQFHPKHRISAGYGLHSQLEKLSFYLADIPTDNGIHQLNQDLQPGKAHHLVFAYDAMLNDHWHARVEPYYQALYDIPVVDNTPFSMINLVDDFFINDELVNEGTGTNYGIDFTLERYLHNGWFGLWTLSLFESTYKGGDGIERSTRFNRNVIGNFLIGKEWMIKNKNILSASVKYTYLGGDRRNDILEAESLASHSIVEDMTNPFSVQNPASNVASVTFTYRINHRKFASHWSLQVLNVMGAKEYLGYRYNYRDHTLDLNTDVVVVPNLSYKFEF